jgi:hypothetical protein
VLLGMKSGNQEILRMMEPTPDQVERATTALVPFVQEWNLSLNPEDLAEIAYAVLVHHDSDAHWDEIDAAVRAQIEEHRQKAEALSRAMRDGRRG